VLRLASVLWRLRRATTMETGLFDIQASHLKEFRQARQAVPASRTVIHTLNGQTDSVSHNRPPASHNITNATQAVAELNPMRPVVDPIAPSPAEATQPRLGHADRGSLVLKTRSVRYTD
jgi:hypothetical protein